MATRRTHLELRKGMWLLLARSAIMTPLSAERLLLMFCVSFSSLSEPLADVFTPLFAMRSLPARSTRCMTPLRFWDVAACVSLMRSVKTLWLRLETALELVAPVDRDALAVSSSAARASTSGTSCVLRPVTTVEPSFSCRISCLSLPPEDDEAAGASRSRISCRTRAHARAVQAC